MLVYNKQSECVDVLHAVEFRPTLNKTKQKTYRFFSPLGRLKEIKFIFQHSVLFAQRIRIDKYLCYGFFSHLFCDLF